MECQGDECHLNKTIGINETNNTEVLKKEDKNNTIGIDNSNNSTDDKAEPIDLDKLFEKTGFSLFIFML